MGQKVQNIKIALWRRKEGSEGNAAKDMPGEGILSTFSLPRKNNDQENELQNIKIATNH